MSPVIADMSPVATGQLTRAGRFPYVTRMFSTHRSITSRVVSGGGWFCSLGGFAVARMVHVLLLEVAVPGNGSCGAGRKAGMGMVEMAVL